MASSASAVKQHEPQQKKWWTHPSEREDTEDPAIPATARKTYEAFCHCQAVAYTVRVPILEASSTGAGHNVSVCNCSICSKASYLFVYPFTENVTILRGEDKLKSYSFASKRLNHRFCSECGSNVFIELAELPAEEKDKKKARMPCNVRMFRAVDLDKLNYIYFDGKTRTNPEANQYTW